MCAEILHFNTKLKVHRKLNYLPISVAQSRDCLTQIVRLGSRRLGPRDFLPTALTCGCWQSPHLWSDDVREEKYQPMFRCVMHVKSSV